MPSCPFPTCMKNFKRKGDLTRHKLLHEGVRPFKCDQCCKAFSQRSALNTHANTHTKKKPHACRIGGCQAAFGDPSSCSRHRKEKHGGGEAYRCVVPGCQSRIKRRSAFNVHLRKHGIDPNLIHQNPASSRRSDFLYRFDTDSSVSRTPSPQTVNDFTSERISSTYSKDTISNEYSSISTAINHGSYHLPIPSHQDLYIEAPSSTPNHEPWVISSIPQAWSPHAFQFKDIFYPTGGHSQYTF